MENTTRCPYCQEEIQAAAIRCRWCRSRLQAFDPEGWFRDHPDRRLAGVAAALARAVAMPAGAVRLGFVVLTFVHLLGPILYGALWLLVPFGPGDPSPLMRGVARVRAVLDAFQHGTRGSSRGAGSDGPQGRVPERSAA